MKAFSYIRGKGGKLVMAYGVQFGWNNISLMLMKVY